MVFTKPITPQLKNMFLDISFHKDGEEQYKERILLFIKNKLEEKNEEFFQWYSFCVRRNSIDYLDIKEIDSAFFHKYKFEILSFFNPSYIKQLNKTVKEYTEEEKSYFDLANRFNNSRVKDSDKKYIYKAVVTNEEKKKFGKYSPSVKTYELMKSINIDKSYIDFRKEKIAEMVFDNYGIKEEHKKEIIFFLEKIFKFKLSFEQITSVECNFIYRTGDFWLKQNDQELNINNKNLEGAIKDKFTEIIQNRLFWLISNIKNRILYLERIYNN